MPFTPITIKDASGLRSAKNSTGSTIATRLVVKKGNATDTVLLPSASTDACYGVTTEAIANGEYGTVQTTGRAICTAGAALATIGTKVMPTSAGKVIAWTAVAGTNAANIGVTITAAAADADVVEIELAGPFAMEQG